MNDISRAIAILGIATALGGLTPTVRAASTGNSRHLSVANACNRDKRSGVV